MEIKAEVKVVIKNGSLFMMGPGVFSLLCAIRDSSSVSEAARTLEISYSKAWKMIREAEKGSGESLVIRSSGGKGGGKASLTPTALSLLDSYSSICREVSDFAQKAVSRNLLSSSQK